MRTALSVISRISRFPEAMNGRGGVAEVSQFTSNQELIEQPDPTPMPKGYGTVRFPHLLWQFGLMEFVAASALER